MEEMGWHEKKPGHMFPAGGTCQAVAEGAV